MSKEELIEEMNCKLEKFWNKRKWKNSKRSWKMNCKLEKFWNASFLVANVSISGMNCKLEKFWNKTSWNYAKSIWRWTINLKSFEIENSKHINIVYSNEL